MDTFQVLGVICVLAGYIPIIWSLYNKRTTQNPVSWIIWALIAIFSFLASALVHSKETNWLALAYIAGGGAVAVLASVGGRSNNESTKLERAFPWVVCAPCCILWGMYPQYAVYWMSVASNVAGIPLLIHAWKHPDQQIVESWILFAMGAVLQITLGPDPQGYVYQLGAFLFGLTVIGIVAGRGTVTTRAY